MELLCWDMAGPYIEVQEPLLTCTPCFHTSRISFPHSEFCHAIFMVCAMMACYVLEKSKCGTVDNVSSGPGRVVGEVA
jgi:hypothetical protein